MHTFDIERGKYKNYVFKMSIVYAVKMNKQ